MKLVICLVVISIANIVITEAASIDTTNQTSLECEQAIEKVETLTPGEATGQLRQKLACAGKAKGKGKGKGASKPKIKLPKLPKLPLPIKVKGNVKFNVKGNVKFEIGK